MFFMQSLCIDLCKVFLQTPLFWPLGAILKTRTETAIQLQSRSIDGTLFTPCQENHCKTTHPPLKIINSIWYPRNTIVTTYNYPSNINKLHLLPHRTPFFQITTTSKGHFFSETPVIIY